uniref:ATP synthase F0 subunit 8 n=1 Tax=Scymninae sp. 2 ACP-2013 TaxID=1434583 RepID=A0A3G3ME42_9CUCU|nr:ATP synthase F0 subunit 8 [Scymninae sp. 2 ACP-2013]
MPQMMPLNWMMLMIYFIMIFLLFNILIYFNNLSKPMNFKKMDYNKMISWKW